MKKTMIFTRQLHLDVVEILVRNKPWEVQNLYFMFIIALHSQSKTIHSIYKYQ